MGHFKTYTITASYLCRFDGDGSPHDVHDSVSDDGQHWA